VHGTGQPAVPNKGLPQLAIGWRWRSQLGGRSRLEDDEAPNSLSKQPNGSISSVSASDVVSINEYYNTRFQADGHVLLVNALRRPHRTVPGSRVGRRVWDTWFWRS
jgi:hypothetical protein